MADALVFGAPNALASRIADALGDALHARVRYQRSAAENAAPGVAICTTMEAFAAGAPIMVLADGEAPGPAAPAAERAAILGILAQAVTGGRYVRIIPDKESAKAWAGHLRAESLFAGSNIDRLYIVGATGAGKTTLAGKLGPSLGLPVTELDLEFWGPNGEDADGRAKTTERVNHVRELAARERWLIEGGYWRALAPAAERANAVIHLDLPSALVAEQRNRRGPTVKRSFLRRLRFNFWLKSYPLVEARLLRRELARTAHLTAVFSVRNQDELAAVIAGFSGAPAPADPPT